MNAIWPEYFSPEVVKQAFGGGTLSSYTIALEAWRRGLNVTILDANLRRYRISDGSRTVSMNDSRPSSLTSRADYRKLLRKWDTKRLLEASGVPVPRGVFVDTGQTDVETLRAHADKVGYPMVLKPNEGTMGRGVLTDIASWEQLLEGYRHLVESLGATSIVMEQHFAGDDLRILVIGDAAVAACRRIPANVTGDGRSTVSELIKSKNSVRRRNPFLSKGIITVDYEVERRLKDEGLTLNDVLAEGRRVALRRIANASAGGDVVDVTDQVPGTVLQAAVQAVKAVPNIVIAGVDVLYTGEEGAPKGSYTIIEMNSRPHIGVNMYPTEGLGRDAPKAYLDHLFPLSPRPLHESDKMLAFDVEVMRPALRSGIARAVDLTPIPPHRFKVRELVTFSDPDKTVTINPAERDRIERIARDGRVAGRIYRENSELNLLLAGGDAEALGKVRAYWEKVVGRGMPAESTSRAWEGPVVAGFKVDRSLIKRKG